MNTPRRRIFAWAALVLPLFGQAQTNSNQSDKFPNIDQRLAAAHGASASAPGAAVSNDARERARDSLRAKVKNVRVDRDELLDTPAFIGSVSSFLTGPDGAGLAVSDQALNRFPASDPYRAVKALVDDYSDLFGHRSDVVASARVARDYVTAHNGLRTIVWEQTLDDIRVFEATFQAHLTRRGELVSVASRLLANPDLAAQRGAPGRAARIASPAISARAAVAAAAAGIGEALTENQVTPQDTPQGADAHQHFTAPTLLGAEARFVWLPMSADTLRLAWEVICVGRTSSFMYRVLVDAETGALQVRQSLTEELSNATYRVFTSDSPSPFSPGHSAPSSVQPPLVSRTLVTLSALNTTASPNGWIDDGVMETRGNNVDAHTDLDANNVADLPRPQATGADRVFDPPLDLTQSPGTYRDAAVVNLFYWCNFMHDKLYELGFTEAAGNFQVNNFGRGGLGNDAVQADAQDGSGTNNANFSTPPDGSAGRMQMYVFTGPTPDRDGDLDSEVMLHEYTHGLSNRLVGGGVGMSALQSRGMGEGWSDFYALCLLSAPGDNVNGNYASGGYSTYQLSGLTENYYYGIRRYPYSTNLANNPLTFKDLDPAQASAHSGIPRSPIVGSTANEVHNMGEVWCVTLWDARANLVNKYGPATGNQLVLQLVTDGMKLSPANPTYLQARDAIIQADLVDTGGVNRTELWAAFAKRGMGFDAWAPANSTTTGLVENFDLPDDLSVNPFAPSSASGDIGGPFSPASQMFTLTNTGTAPLSWTASKTQPWITLGATSGTVVIGSNSTVTATINSAANSLPVGTYTDTITFTNTTSGRVHTRTMTLSVQPPRFAFYALDSDPGWTRSGEWAFGHPTGQGGPFGYPDPANAATGSNVFGINLNGNYAVVVGSAQYLTAGPFNFTGIVNTRVQFQRWLNTDALGWVTQSIEVSRNGSTWTRVWQNSNTTPILENAWTKVQHDISAVADNQATVYIRWGHQVTSTNTVPLSGWNIDDVEFLGQSGAAAPVITVQPVNQIATVGGNATFSVTATGLPVPSYQWKLNGLPIAGATSSSLTLTNVQLIDVGAYTVVVSNTVGSVTSNPATLSGSAPVPTIVNQPANVSIVAGQNASFTASATGNPPLVYQWRRNGFALAGATSPTLTLNGASRVDADSYDVLVGSGLSALASQAARLTVAPTSYPTVVAPSPAWDMQPELTGDATGYAILPLADGRAYIAGAFTSITGARQTQIARIKSDGTVDTTFVPPEIDNRVRALAVQPDGKIVIGGEFIRINGVVRNRLARLNADGSVDPTFATGAGAGGTVLALRVQADGRVLVGGSFTGIGGTSRNFLARLNPDGTIDPSFLTLGTTSNVNAIALQADGRILIGGGFANYLDGGGASISRPRLARLNADGSLDNTFAPGLTTSSGSVNDVAVQTDGKIVIGGSFTAVGATSTGLIARLNVDGSLDTPFTTAGGAGFGTTSAVNTITLQADGRILVGGTFTTYAAATANRFVRLNTDGTRDAGLLTLGFTSTVNIVVVQSTGRILVGGFFSSYLNSSNVSTSRPRFARLNADGTLDSGYNFTSFRAPGTVNAVVSLPGGKTLITGIFTQLRGAASDIAIARINADGSVDTSFNPGGSGANSNIYAAATQPDGKIVIAGFFPTYNSVTTNGLARLNPDGSIDASFALGAGLGGSSGYCLAILPGGRVFVGGAFSSAGGASRGRVAIFNPDGSIDPTFAPSSGGNSNVYTVAVQPDGKFLIGGLFTSFNGTTVGRIARVNTNGTLDTTFNSSGTGANSEVSSLALQPDGKIVIGGTFTSYNGTSRNGVARLNANGTLDTSFVPPSVGAVHAVLVQEDGKVLLRGAFLSVAGAANTAYFARLNADGSRDTTFASGGFVDANNRPTVITMRDNGQVIMQSNGVPAVSATQASGPPTIIAPPTAQFAAIGDSVTFTVGAASLLLPSYQWLYNNNPVAGATNATLTLSSVRLVDAGSYSVVVSNELGSTTSPTASLTVNKLSAPILLSNLLQTYDGTPHSVGVTTVPAGLVVDVTYNGTPTPPTDAGSYAVIATVVDATYAGTASATLVIRKAAATIALSSLSAVYDGTPKTVTTVTTPGGLGVNLTYDGAVDAPTNAGSYAVVANIVDNNYTGSATGTLVIAKAPATVALGALNAVYDGTAKAAAVATTPPGLHVALTYNGSTSAPVNAGSYSVVATVAETNYAGTANGTLVIAKANAAVALSNLLQSYDGTPKTVGVTTTPAGLAVVVTYNGDSPAPTYPGAYRVLATITAANYSGSATGALAIVTTALARHVSALGGGIDGSMQVVTPENIALNGNAWVSGDLLVAGTPSVVLNGTPAFVGTRDAAGSAEPSGYAVMLNGTVALRYLVRRIDPAALPDVNPVPAPEGTRDVIVDTPGYPLGDLSIVRDITLESGADSLALPPGTYGTLTTNGHRGFVLGIAGATEPAVYNVQGLALNGNSPLEIVGPVVLNVANGFALNSDAGAAGRPDWLVLNIHSGGLALSGAANFRGSVVAPNGTVTIDGSASLIGRVTADALTVGGNGQLSAPLP